MIDRENVQVANFGGVKEAYVAVRGNTYPIKDQIKAIGGRWDAANKVWMIPEFRADYIEGLMKSKGLDQPKADPVREADLNVGGILKLFAGSKRPIQLRTSDGVNIRLSVAGDRSKEPGSITVTTAAAYGDRVYIGRIGLNGTYTGAYRYSAQKPVVEILKALSVDPVTVAKAYGDQTHRCCFCSIRLTTKASIAAGYGPVCADNRGLPWGGDLHKDKEEELERGNDAYDPGNEAEAAMVNMEIERTEHERLVADRRYTDDDDIDDIQERYLQMAQDQQEADVFEREGEITARVGAYSPWG